ncbi:ATP-binding cassette sub-family B member 7, mitochondrial [Thelohanellus kitauei]|uniref:ATP-binding cassette sub-family B member 7, mitochondrial n=1 Tax=Thelohanellus kitauei TaxID=669202 RepID=A0A0C2IVB2_THEKT|nr:ATP-binding cassette sub-family B member 7, mitochondrial [Thelohanellus kitauei]
MNQADNESGSKSVDCFINYETVKQYDQILQKYENASLKTISSLSTLNIGQNAIFSLGLVGVMALATNGIFLSSLTIGDLVMLNTLLFQLSIPLNFLGSTYRDIRQSLVDLQNLFGLMQTERKIKVSGVFI